MAKKPGTNPKGEFAFFDDRRIDLQIGRVGADELRIAKNGGDDGGDSEGPAKRHWRD